MEYFKLCEIGVRFFQNIAIQESQRIGTCKTENIYNAANKKELNKCENFASLLIV